MRRWQFLVCFEGEGGGGAGGSATPPAPAAPAALAAPAPSPAPPAVAAPAPKPAGGIPPPVAPPAKPTFTYEEDRSKWVKPEDHDRLQQDLRLQKSNAERFRRMIEAAEGFAPPGPGREIDPKAQTAFDAIMDVISQVNPALAQTLNFLSQLQEKNPRLLEQVFTRFPALDSGYQSVEQRRGLTAIDAVLSGAAQAMGTTADKLSPFQRSRLGNGFAEWVESDVNLQRRYAQDDPTLVKDFLTEWTTGFAAPAARSAAAPDAEIARRAGRLPGAPRKGGVPVGGPGERPKPKNPDEVHQGAWDSFAAATGIR